MKHKSMANATMDIYGFLARIEGLTSD